jgi:hypothetical protein
MTRHLQLGLSVLLAVLSAFAPLTSLADIAKPQTATAGPYTITLNQSTFTIGKDGFVSLTVRENGAVAVDLLPYGGASGLADFVNTQTGTVFHTTVNRLGTSVESTSPVNAATPPANVGGEVEISPPGKIPAGAYTLIVQIKGAGEEIYTASFSFVMQ